MTKKTVYDIVQEYLNRLKEPEYEQIRILSDDGQHIEFCDVWNLKTEKDESGKWLVFDSELGGKKRHVKMHGHVIMYTEKIKG